LATKQDNATDDADTLRGPNGDGDERQRLEGRAEASETETEVPMALPDGKADTDGLDFTADVHNIMNSLDEMTCAVCDGTGRLPVKVAYLRLLDEVGGAITSHRRRPDGWIESGHVPHVVARAAKLLLPPPPPPPPPDNDDAPRMTTNDGRDRKGGKDEDEDDSLLSRANGHDLGLRDPTRGRPHDDRDGRRRRTARRDVFVVPSSPRPHLSVATVRTGREAVQPWSGGGGYFRRVASHRWTTDDLVTAYVAASTVTSGWATRSVLLMVVLVPPVVDVVVVVVSLRQGGSRGGGGPFRGGRTGSSVASFNLGVGGTGTSERRGTRRVEHDVWIIRGRHALYRARRRENDRDCPFASTMEAAALTRYDLITGTPPYFRVVFASSGDGAHDERTLDDGKDDDRDIDEDGRDADLDAVGPCPLRFRRERSLLSRGLDAVVPRDIRCLLLASSR
ncbi:hypothetical protein ACHAW5_008081, partial [Stephanodiscus triporus]